ncbi:MAG: FKBP-type peptidyl-prolyl cis-trans isomerase [Ignavibacteria bacterium]|nr:FKBP-type peptidyl-prolyl cis-trans isomerase [Ignavibacteria bacterium]
MRIISLAALVSAFAIACNAQPKVLEMKPMNKKDSASYAIGTNIGQNFKQQSLNVNIEMVAAGLRDALSDTSLFTEEQTRAVLMAFQEENMKKQNEVREKQGAESIKLAEKFLAENKTKPGVMVTASGLQYKVIKEGTGPKPTAEDKVRVHYTGTLIDGKKFDSSYDRGTPTDFQVNQVIPGWQEGVQLMSVGSKYMFYIHPSLGYGPQGMGGVIGPNAALIFEVELIEILK